MASSNLVRLFNAELPQGHNSFSYGCDQVESVYFHLYCDPDVAHQMTSAEENSCLEDIFISISIGTENICNRIEMGALADICQYEQGTGFFEAFSTASDIKGGIAFEVPVGTQFLDKGAELQVDVINNSDLTAAADMPFLAVGASVNGVSPPNPIRLVKRTDSAFMIPAVETLYAWDFDGAFQASSDEVNLQYGTENVTIPLDIGFTKVLSDTVGDTRTKGSLCLVYDGIPRDMQVNTSATGLTFIATTKVVVDQSQVVKARRWIPNKLKSLSPKERVLLAQGA